MQIFGLFGFESVVTTVIAVCCFSLLQSIQSFCWLIGLLIIELLISVVWLFNIVVKNKRHIRSVYFRTNIKQVIVRWVINNRYFQISDYKQQKRETFTTSYFPKIYVSFSKENQIAIYLPIDGSKYQENLLSQSTKDFFENYLQADLQEIVSSEHQQVLIFSLSPLKNRMNIDEVTFSSDSITFMKGLTWRFASEPHALITGESGSGKSYFLFALIGGLIKSGAKVHIIDPKESDLSTLHTIDGLFVAFDMEKSIKLISWFYQKLQKRQEGYRRKNEQDHILGDYRQYGMQAEFLLIDEYAAFITNFRMYKRSKLLDKDPLPDVEGMLFEIVMKGRQVGLFMIYAMQRPSNDVLDIGVRDQLALRVVLGKSKRPEMVFGETTKRFQQLSKDKKGWGYIQIGASEPRIFWAPEVPKNFNFYQWINKITK